MLSNDYLLCFDRMLNQFRSQQKVFFLDIRSSTFLRQSGHGPALTPKDGTDGYESGPDTDRLRTENQSLIKNISVPPATTPSYGRSAVSGENPGQHHPFISHGSRQRHSNHNLSATKVRGRDPNKRHSRGRFYKLSLPSSKQQTLQEGRNFPTVLRIRHDNACHVAAFN